MCQNTRLWVEWEQTNGVHFYFKGRELLNEEQKQNVMQIGPFVETAFVWKV